MAYYSSTFCDSCRRLFTADNPSKDSVGEISTSWSGLRKAVDDGCPFCFYIYHNLTPEEEEAGWRTSSTGMVKIEINLRCPVDWNSFSIFAINDSEPHFSTLADGRTIYRPKFKLYNFDRVVRREQTRFAGGPPNLVRPEPKSKQASKDIQSTSTGDPNCFRDTIRPWLENCCMNHATCRYPNLEGFLPTRLIDVGNDGDKQVKLHVTKDWSSKGNIQYATLSHRWGNTSFLKLNHSNFARMQHGIMVESLTQTFKDAILTTRNINCQYLWIDSLCILQDDEKDWLTESSSMHKIYQYSYCNIAAAKALNGPDGFFSTRDRRHGQMVTVKVRWREVGMAGTFAISDHEAWSRNVLSSALHKRAWVFQELILSPRILHFGENQVFWECEELSASESTPRYRSPHHDEVKYFSTPAQVSSGRKYVNLPVCYGLGSWSTLIETPSDMEYDDDRSGDHWMGIVEQYSATHLTFPGKDKFLAISGVARRFLTTAPFSPGYDRRYLAGLWAGGITRQLLWNFAKDINGFPEDYQAPSWSWASRNKSVEFLRFRTSESNKLATLVGVALNLRNSDDPFGPVTSGSITLSAPIRVERDDDFVNKGVSSYGRDWDYIYDDNKSCPVGDLYLLGVTAALDREDSYLAGIVLQPTKKQDGEYRRVGTFDTSECGYLYMPLSDYFGKRQPVEGEYLKSTYDSTLGIWNYEITII